MTRAAWWLLPTAVGLMACPPPSPGVDAGVDAGVSLSAVEVCQRISAAKCELRVRCYPAFARLSRAECVDQAQAQCLAESESLRPALEAGRLSIDVEQVLGCEQRLTSSACPPSFPPNYPLAVAQPFSDCGLTTGLLRGAVPVNSTCEHPVECAPGTFCVKPNGVCLGTCVGLSKLGEPCGIGCADGLRCDGTTCALRKTIDEPCTRSAECEPELVCLGSCRPRRKLNESCRVDFDRLSPCEPGLACDVTPFVDGAEGTCIVPGEANADCRFHWSCKPGLVCADIDWTGFPASAPPLGYCRQPDPAQSNCAQTPYASFVGDQCEPGLSCRDTDGKCQPLPQRGDACSPTKQNCSGYEVYCKPTGSGDIGICTGPAALGETCAVKIDASRTLSIPCSQGFCDTETTLTCRPPSRSIGAVCKQDAECVSGRCVPQEDRTLRCAPPC